MLPTPFTRRAPWPVLACALAAVTLRASFFDGMARPGVARTLHPSAQDLFSGRAVLRLRIAAVGGPAIHPELT